MLWFLPVIDKEPWKDFGQMMSRSLSTEEHGWLCSEVEVKIMVWSEDHWLLYYLFCIKIFLLKYIWFTMWCFRCIAKWFSFHTRVCVCVCVCALSHSGMSNSLWPHALQPFRLLCPWDSPGILQARILEWVAMPSSRGSSQPRNRTQVSHTAGRFFTIWATREDTHTHTHTHTHTYKSYDVCFSLSGLLHLVW